jgi:hypothetical protein
VIENRWSGKSLPDVPISSPRAFLTDPELYQRFVIQHEIQCAGDRTCLCKFDPVRDQRSVDVHIDIEIEQRLPGHAIEHLDPGLNSIPAGGQTDIGAKDDVAIGNVGISDDIAIFGQARTGGEWESRREKFSPLSPVRGAVI